jgi:hypothetical protein
MKVSLQKSWSEGYITDLWISVPKATSSSAGIANWRFVR